MNRPTTPNDCITPVPRDVKHVITQRQLDAMVELFQEPEVKELLVKYIITEIFHVINVQKNLLMLEKEYTAPTDSMMNIYEWSLEKFKERLTQTHKINFWYLASAEKLSILKWLTDLNNLESILKHLHAGDVSQAKKNLLSCKKLLFIQEDVSEDYEKHKTKYDFMKKQVEEFDSEQYLQDAKYDMKIQEVLDRCMDEALVADPILNRYIRNSHRVHFKSLEEGYTGKVNSMINQIEQIGQDIERDMLVHKNILDYFASAIGDLKTKIAFWTRKYDLEYEKYENENVHLGLSIKALKASMKDHQKRIEFFHEDRARLEAELLARAEEKTEVAETGKKKKKGKKDK